VVESEEKAAAAFLNTMQRCFVEPIDGFGARTGSKDYFWSVFRTTYSDLSKPYCECGRIGIRDFTESWHLSQKKSIGGSWG
jgi:hypothetical protein